ncbi:MAG: hypothetical protein DRP86_02335 [Candidatus Neomarinimicrobiota bacterium]|nr:hypothetical protein [Candidatus Neomarinimicrobiota bacterium]RKY51110.1 MAG: hypothetical protein DRP86_02335 [Candidatus Neomarinimicrobiota bacterium]
MNPEISGDVNLIKSSPVSELTGSINILNDAYRIQQTLSIKVNGRMATSEISFLLNVKKISSDQLFVSYKKTFILGQNREIIPDKASAEHELNRNIFIRTTRGGINNPRVLILF